MKIKVRLYSKMDKDLMALYKHPQFSLVKAFAKAIEMSAKADYHYIKLPEQIFVPEAYPKKIELDVNIDDSQQDVIAWWKAIPPYPKGSRNDTLKQMLRGYLSGPVLMTFAKKTGIEYFNSEEKNLISCEKNAKEIRQKYDAGMEKIKKILDQNGQTPEELLALITENNKTEEKNELQQNENTRKNVPQKDVIPEPVIPKTNVPTKEADEPQEDVSSDFDLMGAIGNLL